MTATATQDPPNSQAQSHSHQHMHSIITTPSPFVLQPHLSSHPLVRQALASIILQQRQEKHQHQQALGSASNNSAWSTPAQSPSLIHSPGVPWQGSPHLYPAGSPSSAPVTPLVLGDPHPFAASFRMEREMDLGLMRVQSPLASGGFMPESKLNE